jgi:hypothetical protein
LPFRGLRLGSFLVPLGVSILPVSVLIWYGLVHIPTQENYLNERNLRLLMTLAGNIKTKVDNFDSAIDHAVQSFGSTDSGSKLRKGVHLFASELDILTVSTVPPKAAADADTEAAMLATASDPPRIRIDRDEGRSYLYLGAKLQQRDQTVWVVARTDIGKVVAPFISSRNEFDAVLLVTRSGEVIAQQSPIGLGLARIDGVLAARGDLRATDRNAAATEFASVRDFSNMMPLRIGGADYKLYMQPVPLSLLGDDGRRPDQWVVCGLVRADRFHAESASLSFAMLLWFGAALAVVFLAIPFVKLRVVRPRERLHASDAGWVVSASFAAVGLLAVALLDVGVFAYAFPSTVDARLAAVSNTIASHLLAEVGAIDNQGRAFDRQIGDVFARVSSDLNRRRATSPTVAVGDPTDQRLVSCDPPDACKTELREQLGGEATAYPYVYLATWIGKDGWQRVKWTPGVAITPFINIRDENLPYYAELKSAWSHPSTGATPARGVSVLESPNTGQPLTVFWRVGTAGTDDAKASSQSIAIFSPIALDRPTLPKGVSFAVVDTTGRAIFHSDPTRSLQENFLKECEDNPALTTAISSRQPASMKAYYLGRPSRLHVRPLTLTPFKDPQWSLITFQDSATADTVNLETVTVACLLLLAYGGMLAFASLALSAFGSRGWTKWFWPANGNDAAYTRAAWMNGAVAIGFVCIAPLMPAAWSWVIIVAMAPAALIATRQIIVRSGSRKTPRDFNPTHPFFLARAGFLLVVAGLPAIAGFQAAYAFETKLLATTEHIREMKDKDGRDDRIDRFVARFSLRDGTTTQMFVADRRRVDWDIVHATLWPDADGARSMFDPILARAHKPYNDIALELLTAADTHEMVAGARAAAGFWVVAALVCVLFGFCYALVYLAKPLFVLDAVAPPAPSAARIHTPSPRVLTIGPPGSGKSTQLAGEGAIRIFDVARLGYLERRKTAASVAHERRRPAAAAAAVGSRQWWSPPQPSVVLAFSPAHNAPAAWADAFDYSTLPGGPDATLGIDHLDYRLEERDFAAQTLRFLERAVHTCSGSIRVVCDRDPLVCLRESGAAAPDVDRWTRALASFRMEIVGVDNLRSAESHDIARHLVDDPSIQPDEALDAYGVAAAPQYEALWRACTADEQLALYHLGHEGLVNPQNQGVAQRLMRLGLVVRDPIPRVMNESFRRFVLKRANAEEVSAWERRGVAVPWGSIKAAMMTVVVGLAALLVVTQQQLVSAWVGFVPTLVPAAQRLWTVFAAMRPQAKGDHVA